MKIIFQPDGKTINTDSNNHLLKIAAQAGIMIDASCAGTKKCGKCKVKILHGSCNPLTDTELKLLSEHEIQERYRLACCTYAASDLEVMIPKAHGGSHQKKKLTKLPSDFIPDNKYDACSTDCYGIAFDIGTTTVVGMLWSLLSGELIDVEALTNYQSVHGADIISRIQFCNKDPDNISAMQKKIINCLNDILDKLYARNGIKADSVSDVTVVGNTTMSHLFLGVSPKSLARAPFTPVFSSAQNVSAKDLGLNVSHCANIHLLPNIAGHVGSDIVGMILASGIYKKSGSHIAIDIGTNGEIVAIKDGKMLTCSTAAGPAFEGATIAQGMRAAAGAIEYVKITSDDVIIKTIDDQPAIGICGSGLIDIVAELLKSNIVDETGRMFTKDKALEAGIHPSLASRLNGSAPNISFRLTPDDAKTIVSITQQDIREVQLAKGAILAGIQTLMKILDMQEETIDSIMIAGAFGNYIQIENALKIGLFPDIPLEKIISIGNAAGAGSSMALLSAQMRELASKIAVDIQHIELSLNIDFQEFYIYAMNFE